ncbi:hypothetical protein KIL84_007951 [Mauremys mutica]|uniref:Uncharacterized protein n=1 Tax=Mauremys mutica TaxID=74926 RepID=A0A9D4AVK2_9SAUR|nr:hypothetical protein KIL84_007951 [Mauremys mutica]
MYCIKMVQRGQDSKQRNLHTAKFKTIILAIYKMESYSLYLSSVASSHITNQGQFPFDQLHYPSDIFALISANTPFHSLHTSILSSLMAPFVSCCSQLCILFHAIPFASNSFPPTMHQVAFIPSFHSPLEHIYF